MHQLDRTNNWQGHPGTAVTIRVVTGTKKFEGSPYVGFGEVSGRGWVISDFIVPVMKLEPRSVTVFFANDETDNSYSLALSSIRDPPRRFLASYP